MSNQFIYLTQPANLQEGLYFARRLTGERDLGRGQWMIVALTGHFPFLAFCVVASYYKQTKSWEPESAPVNSFNPSEWEFGPRIEPPKDGQRLGYPPVAMESKP